MVGRGLRPRRLAVASAFRAPRLRRGAAEPNYVDLLYGAPRRGQRSLLGAGREIKSQLRLIRKCTRIMATLERKPIAILYFKAGDYFFQTVVRNNLLFKGKKKHSRSIST